MNEYQSNTKSIRYYSLDTYKTIAALWIICLHGKLPDAISGELCALARTAVPFFFMVSGFFSYRPDLNENKRRKKRTRKIIRYSIILLGVTLVYTCYYFLLVILKKIDMAEFLSNFDFSFWLMHFSSISGHLWFVRSLIYMEMIFLLFEPVFAKRTGLYIALGLWIFDVVFFKYSGILFHMTIPEPYFEILTKFFGSAMVFYILGYQCKIHEKQILSCLKKIKLWVSVLTGGILIVMNLVEYHILTSIGMNQMPANYITTLLFSVYLFVWLLANRNIGKQTFINRIGEKYSMHIYYWHLLVIFISGVFCRIIGIPDLIYLNPLVVFAETLVITSTFLKMMEILRSTLKK